jgi:hypothetical protein
MPGESMERYMLSNLLLTVPSNHLYSHTIFLYLTFMVSLLLSIYDDLRFKISNFAICATAAVSESTAIFITITP